DRRNAHPRDWPLLWLERGGDRRDRGQLLARRKTAMRSNRRTRGDRKDTSALRSLRAPRLLSRKRFGQHFLEPAWVEKVIRAIDPKPEEAFLEIGPGRGALTRPLAARAKAIVAFEIDRDLGSVLAATAPPNVGIVYGDFLDATWT